MGKLIGAFVGLVVAVGLALGLSALIGYVFMLLWNFVAPQIVPTAPRLSFWVAWAALFLIGMIRGQVTVRRK